MNIEKKKIKYIFILIIVIISIMVIYIINTKKGSYENISEEMLFTEDVDIVDNTYELKVKTFHCIINLALIDSYIHSGVPGIITSKPSKVNGFQAEWVIDNEHKRTIEDALQVYKNSKEWQDYYNEYRDTEYAKEMLDYIDNPTREKIKTLYDLVHSETFIESQ